MDKAAAVRPVVSNSPFSELASRQTFQRPSKTDWHFQPSAWSKVLTQTAIEDVKSGDTFGFKTKIFHNARNAQISAFQRQGQLGAQHTPHDVELQFSEFNGTYISFDIGLPLDILAKLSRRNLIDVSFSLETKGIESVYVRLNADNGPNTDKSIEQVHLTGDPILIGFDMKKFLFNVGSTQKIWIDISFDCKEKGSILLRDLNVYRRIRAAI